MPGGYTYGLSCVDNLLTTEERTRPLAEQESLKSQRIAVIYDSMAYTGIVHPFGSIIDVHSAPCVNVTIAITLIVNGVPVTKSDTDCDPRTDYQTAAAKAGFDTSKSYRFKPFTPKLPGSLGAFHSFLG